MSSASPASSTRLRMKLRSRGSSREIASEMLGSCSAIVHRFLSACSIYRCRRTSETDIVSGRTREPGYSGITLRTLDPQDFARDRSGGRIEVFLESAGGCRTRRPAPDSARDNRSLFLPAFEKLK